MSDVKMEEFGEEEFGGREEIGARNEGEESGGGGGSCSVENDGKAMSFSSPNKRIKELSIDRISALPDSLLLRILALLDTKEAASTSILSKRWQFLWTDLSSLKFCESSSQIEKIRMFVALVNRTLVFSNGVSLNKFEVDFVYDKSFAVDVNVWVESAIFNNVRDFSLQLNSSSEDVYKLPLMMFTNLTIKRLTMRGCTMAPQRTVEWQSLGSLHIEEVELPQDVIEKILSGCPVLAHLLIKACWGFSRLEISQKLRQLAIVDREDGKNEALLEISAPDLDFLIIKHSPKGRQLRLTNISSLTKAYIDFIGSDWDAASEEVMSGMKDLLEIIRHVEELELGCRCVEVISVLVTNSWQPPQSKRWGLVLNASSDKYSIFGIIGLLESSPDLRILVIDGYEPRGAPVTVGPARRRDLDCELLHLKTVQLLIFDLYGEPLLTIAKSLLKKAPALDVIVIDADEYRKVTSTASTISLTDSTLSPVEIVKKLSQALKMGKSLISLLESGKVNLR